MCMPTALPFLLWPSANTFRGSLSESSSLRFIGDCSGSGLFLALAALTPPTTLELFQSLSAPALLRTCNLWDSSPIGAPYSIKESCSAWFSFIL